MSYASLHDYLDSLARDSQLTRVAVEVDPDLEVAEIARRVEGQGGPVVHFQNVLGSTAGVVTGLFSTPERICRALGLDSLDQIADQIAAALEQPRRSWYERLSGGNTNDALDRFRPKPIKNAACQQVVHLGSDVDLNQWPTLKSWPEESGRSQTGVCVLSQHPESGVRSVERLTLPIHGSNQLALTWQSHGATATNFTAATKSGEKLPVSVVLGGPPAFTLAAEMPNPPQVDPLTITGLLRDIPLEVVRCRTHELEVPAEAEVVIEGYVDPTEPVIDVGRFAARTGYCLSNNAARVLRVTALSHRSEPIIPASPPANSFSIPSTETVVGESAAIVKMIERLTAMRLRSVLPEVAELNLPAAAPCGSLAIVSVNKSRPHQARQVAGAIWALPELMFTRTVLIVDAEVDVFDWQQVIAQMSLNVHPERDVFTQDGPTALWDHASNRLPTGHKLGIDATHKLPGECSNVSESVLPGRVDQETLDQVTRRWSEYGLGQPTETGS